MNAVDYSDADFNVQTAYLIGKAESIEVQNQLYAESETYDDLIQEDFLDSYNNLTLKTAMLMKFVNRKCIGKGIRY